MMTDAFNRARISQPETLFDSTFVYDLQPYLWETTLTGGATLPTHDANNSCATLTLSTTSGDKIVMQTQYHRYQPGKSQLIYLTNIAGAGVANVRKRWGYFDANDGVFFEQAGTTFKVVRRKNGSDTTVSASGFNGVNNFAIDFTATNLWFIDFGWLGVAPARLGMVAPNGDMVTLHTFKNPNILTTPWTRTGSLPVRYEIENTDTSAGGSFKPICCTVISEGGQQDENKFYNSASTGIAGRGSVTSASFVPILSIRPKGTFNRIVNRAQIIPEDFEIYTSNPIEWKILYLNDATEITTASWVSAGFSSCIEYDILSTAIGSPVTADGTAYTYNNDTGVVGTITFGTGTIANVAVGQWFKDSTTGEYAQVQAVNAGAGEFTIASGLSSSFDGGDFTVQNLEQVTVRGGFLGGTVATRGDFEGQINGRIALDLNTAGGATSGRVLTIAAKALNTTATVHATLNWGEYH